MDSASTPRPGRPESERERADQVIGRHPDPDLLAALASTAVELRKLRPAITAGMTALLATGIEHLDDPQLVELLAASIDSNISTLMDVWEHDIPIERLSPPTAAIEYALRLAQRGIPESSLLRAYHMGQNDLLEACFRVVELVDIPDHLRFDTVHRISAVVYRYVDWIVLHLLATYEQERRTWLDGQSTMHSAVIHRVVAGDDVDEDTFRGETGYRLDQYHVAAVLRVEDGFAEPTESGLTRALAAAVGAVGPPLLTAVDRSTTWAWFPLGPRQVGPVDVAAVEKALPPAPCRVALGVPGQGVAGFRRSHDQAAKVHSLQTPTSELRRRVVSFADDAVAVVVRLADDLEGTRVWVAETLGPLARRSENERRLRETLLTYLRTGGSYAQSAVQLNLHGNTVKYRVKKAMEVRGRPIGDDRLTVEMALQVCAYLGDKVLLND